MPRWSIVAVRLAAWLLFLGVIVWPSVALIARCILDAQPPADGFALSPRQAGLLWRTVWLAAAGTATCLIVSIPSACLIGQSRHFSQRPVIAGLLFGVVLCPPTVYALGWERILPPTFNPLIRCIGVWAFWAWPIPALLIGSGWSRVARPVYEAALMTVPPVRAFLLVALPLLLRHVALSAVIVFVLFLGDYGVPHACLLKVYATELLGLASSSSRAVDALWPAWPVLGVTGLALVAFWLIWRHAPTAEVGVTILRASPGARAGLYLVISICLLVSWVWPMGILAARLGSIGVVLDALNIYGWDLCWSVLAALLAGILGVVMGVGVMAYSGGRLGTLVWTLTLGACPGAVVGAALVAAFNNGVTGWVYDHWPIVVLSYVARFGWIGMATAWVVVRSTPPDLMAQAAVSGAGVGEAPGRLLIPMHWPTLLCGAAVIATLSLADVATSSLVRVPSFTPIAHTLIEKFHRFEDGMLISISVWLVAAALPPALLSALIIRRWRAD